MLRIACFLMLCCSVLAFAQDDPSDKDSPDWSFGPLHDRLILGFQYQYQRVEQPDQVLLNGSKNVVSLTTNPEHYLNQHSITYDFSQVMLTPTQYARARKFGATDSCSDNGDVLTCLEHAGKSYTKWLSGVKVIANISEHPVSVQGAILPAGYIAGGEVDFNPASLFLTGTDWKTIVSNMSKSDKTELANACTETVQKSDNKGEDEGAPADPGTIKCAKSLLSRRKRVNVLAALAPTFQYKRLTAFDFLKYGGALIPSSNSGGLNSYSFTIDARRVIDSVSSRLDAIDTAKTLRQPTAAIKAKLCGLIFDEGSISLISVPKETSKESCLQAANAINAQSYELGCIADGTPSLGRPQSVHSPDPASVPGTNSCSW